MTDIRNGRCRTCEVPLGERNVSRLCLDCTKHRTRTPVAANAQRRRIERERDAHELWRQQLEAKYAPVAHPGWEPAPVSAYIPLDGLKHVAAQAKFAWRKRSSCGTAHRSRSASRR